MLQLILISTCLLFLSRNKIICYDLRRRMELENTMYDLSTLGGAFSALGYHNIEFVSYTFYYHLKNSIYGLFAFYLMNLYFCKFQAKVAAKLSIQQLKIAWVLQDPVLISKCKIYWAMSLIQRGCYCNAKQLIW